MSSERWLVQESLFDLTPSESGTQVWLPEQGERWRGGSWTADTSECPNDGDVCTRPSLSDILLKVEPDAPYWLSPKACAGILRRASRRDFPLSQTLRTELQCQALQRV